MRARTNPWPAFVDLFSALLLAAFGGLTLLSAAYQSHAGDVKVSQVREAAEAIHRRLKLAIQRQPALGAKFRDCGDDTCIDLYIHFPVNGTYITSAAERDALLRLGGDLKNGLDQVPQVDRSDVEVIVEGHADRSQVSRRADRRDAFLYNWDLSARRASSVVYEFRTIQLQSPEYNVVAVGYADSHPLCREESADCEAINRRTTLRLRINTGSLESRLKKH
ncbi:MAG: OmpA family [Thermoanaerobaculia bacterium]|jgi:outer membrane protein OmpA-like peptidoglycan-associated protein|nr:OmpA family [Thermoanaerobaculia bacterium]